MEELIFFAVIILFSIIESVARSRKKRSGGPAEAPSEWEPEPEPEWRPEGRPRETPTATYDADPSYDEIEILESERASDARARSGSEGMIPADIWDEIAGLASGRERKVETERVPAPVPVRRPATTPARESWGKRVPRVGQGHSVHLSHAGYGTDPSERAPSQQDGLDPLARRLSADVRAVRGQLRRSGRGALRQAVILQEVLGPPVSMRTEQMAD